MLFTSHGVRSSLIEDLAVLQAVRSVPGAYVNKAVYFAGIPGQIKNMIACKLWLDFNVQAVSSRRIPDVYSYAYC